MAPVSAHRRVAPPPGGAARVGRAARAAGEGTKIATSGSISWDAAALPPRPARLIAVGGGKGGVGKTFVAANLAVALARQDLEVIAVDVDLEGANLHTCLGVRSPHRSLADFIAQREPDLAKLVIETGSPRLRLIAGTHANLATAQPGHRERLQLLGRLRGLPADVVLIDLGAGTHAAIMDYFLASDDGVVVLSPEPTAVESAYTFLRAAFYRRMRLAMVSQPVRELVTAAMDQHNERGLRTPHDLLREVQARDPGDGARFVEAVRSFRPRLIVNEVRSAPDVKLGFAVRSVCQKYFGIEAEYLGYVNRDDAVHASVMARRPVVDAHPNSDAAIYLERIARKLARPGPAPPARGPAPQAGT